jgi:hypothetical protein
MTQSFEETVRTRTLQSLNYNVAMCGGFNTVADLQQYACGWRAASPDQVESLARRFQIPAPPGYGTVTEKAA